jgi:hypothetical protein
MFLSGHAEARWLAELEMIQLDRVEKKWNQSFDVHANIWIKIMAMILIKNINLLKNVILSYLQA